MEPGEGMELYKTVTFVRLKRLGRVLGWRGKDGVPLSAEMVRKQRRQRCAQVYGSVFCESHSMVKQAKTRTHGTETHTHIY